MPNFLKSIFTEIGNFQKYRILEMPNSRNTKIKKSKILLFLEFQDPAISELLLFLLWNDIYVCMHTCLCVYSICMYVHIYRYKYRLVDGFQHTCIHFCVHVYVTGITILPFCIEFQYFGRKTLHYSIMMMSLCYITNDVISLY